MKPRLFSAMQPTSDSLHLGNHLGALTQWVAMQDSHEAIYAVVDLHALTVPQDPTVLRDRTRRTAAQFLAGGVDPAKSTLFVQSHVHEHAELAWILGCITGFGEAGRMTQFKDKSAKQGDSGTTVGLFTYPVLMAADILLYDAAAVPVGEDQRQHLELSRDLAQRVNTRFGEDTLTVPEPHIVKETAKIYDLQNPTAKMSKSAGPKGVIELLEDPKVITKIIKSAVTDVDETMTVRMDWENKPGISNLLAIYSAVSGRAVADIAAEFDGRGYGYLKVALAEVVVDYLTPIRDSAMDWIESPEKLDTVLGEGAAKASAIAKVTLERMYDRLGLLPPVRR